MVKFDRNPTSSAWRLSIRAAMEWKVPTQGIPSAAGPIICTSRCRISAAALFVKVTARISDGQARLVASTCASRAVSARVLPVPAPASTRTAPSSTVAASYCGGFSPAR